MTDYKIKESEEKPYTSLEGSNNNYKGLVYPTSRYKTRHSLNYRNSEIYKGYKILFKIRHMA